MQNILPNRSEYHVILDDRRDVWTNSPSWYFTRFYEYFQKPKKAEKVEDVDQFLVTEENEPPFKDNIIECYNKVR